MVRRSINRCLFIGLLAFAAGCGPKKTVAVAPTPPPAPPPPAPREQIVIAPTPPPDPIELLIERADARFKSGQRELEAGHVVAAKDEFNKAVELLVESPYGGRTEPRIREYFDRLVERISAYELRALAQGDGFTEQVSEPASIDELLAVSATLMPAGAEAPTSPTVELAGEAGFPIPINPRVQSFVALFQGRLHDFLEDGMRRGSKYLPMIQNVFRAEGLPLDLAYVPLVESAFKPTALSRAKAKGVWQFMRGTGLENGLRSDWYIDERSDPEKATVAAAKYLGSLAKMFEGDWLLALASYNGGPGRVQRAVKASPKDDFWSISSNKRYLPRETRDYVPMILAAIVIARDPATYGFAFESEPMHEYDTVALPRAVDLRRIAEWTETTVDVIQGLNPELRRWTTPVRDDAYNLKVPVGTADVVKARLEEAADTELVTLNWYVVKKGDTLSTVARKLRVSRTDLAEANYMKATARINVGDKLIVPREATVLMAARPDLPVPATDSRPLVRDTVVAAVNPPPTNERIKVTYRVKSGDTLASIARTFSTTVSSIQSWNKLSTTRIVAGERLTIYTSRAN